MGTVKTYLMPDTKSLVWLGLGIVLVKFVLPKL
jgi:hypothetical protein